MTQMADDFENAMHAAFERMAADAPAAPAPQQIRARLRRRSIVRRIAIGAAAVNVATLLIVVALLNRAARPPLQPTIRAVAQSSSTGLVPALSLAIPPMPGCQSTHALSAMVPQVTMPAQSPRLAVPAMHVSSVSLSIPW
jgi:hypothetical protein